MKTLKNILIFLTALTVISSCDIIEEPYIRNEAPPVQKPGRKVLLENFTGHLCETAPGTKQLIEGLQQNHTENLFVVNIHTGSYAATDQGIYDYDFTTQTGDELDNYFNVTASGCSQGLVSRTGNPVAIYTSDMWEQAVDSLTQLTSDVGLVLVNDYNNETRILNLEVKIKFYEDLSKFYTLSVFIVEDSLQKPQKNNNASLGPTPDWEDYMHMNVLRTAITSTLGDGINTGNIELNEEFIINFNDVDIPDEWKDFNCKIIVLVTETTSGEVIQVEEVGLTDVYTPPDEPIITVRKILLEDYTGHTCVNCPGATLVAFDLAEQYPGQVILIAVHAGYFAIPQSQPPYDTDFRTEVGEELIDFFGIITNPSGMVNRVGEGAERILGEGQWPSAVGGEINKPVDAGILITNDYNPQTRVLSTTLEMQFVNNLSDLYRVCAYIIEDSIVSPQKNNDPSVGPTPDILDYVHMHMLRGSLNGTWGDLVTDQEIIAEESYLITLNDYTLPDEWDDGHCAIVAFIYNTNTYEIIQAQEADVKEMK
ncbi:MAG: Omp28-related outer membrane protein [Bacteroidales bacterium]|nr:Omp28-related outer membrane protein [Bacteroidales bacterium]